jgi:hypothetical protein
VAATGFAAGAVSTARGDSAEVSIGDQHGSLQKQFLSTIKLGGNLLLRTSYSSLLPFLKTQTENRIFYVPGGVAWKKFIAQNTYTQE